MIKRIKEMAWSMKLAVLFLLACSITLFYFAPVAGVGITLFYFVPAAIVRVIKYSIEGK